MQLRGACLGLALLAAPQGAQVAADAGTAKAILMRSVAFRTVQGAGQVPKLAAYYADVLREAGFAEEDIVITPMGENRMMVMGSEITPTSISNPFTMPLRPSTGRRANTRTSSEIMNGRINSRITRCCATWGIRRRTNTAMGKPTAKATTTDTDECIMEERKFSSRAEKKKFS